VAPRGRISPFNNRTYRPSGRPSGGSFRFKKGTL